jgi:glycosyltransferase involved in cell wall biosynthesis
MRILHVNRFLDPATGGPPVIASRMCAGLARRGHSVHLAAYEIPSRASAVDAMLRGAPGIEQVQIHRIAVPGRLESLFPAAARNALDAVVRDVEIIHLHGVWDNILRATADLATRHRKPYVVTLHGMLDPWSLSQKRLKKQLALSVLGYRAHLNRAAVLHCGNTDEVRLIEPLGLTPRRVIIGNGFFEEEIRPPEQPGAFRRKIGIADDVPLALFLSRIHLKKGLDYLVDAVALLRQRGVGLQVAICGPDDGYARQLQSQIDARSVNDRVRLIGPIYGQDKLAALADCDLFVLPSRQEGFSMAITEALAMGKPVVISDACHFGEVAEAGAGIVTPLDAAAVADGIAEVLRDRTRAAAMGEAGRRLVLGKYTWPKVAEQLEAMYQSILEAGKR